MSKKSAKVKSKSKATVKSKSKTASKANAKVSVKAKTKPQAKVSAKTKASVKPKVKISAKAKATSKPKHSAKTKTKNPTKAVTTLKSNKPVKKVETKTITRAKLLNEGAPFSPLGDKVLIKKAEAFSEKTAGGLYIPSTAQEKPTEGKVVAIGPGIKTKKGFLKPLDVKVGDKVMYEKFAGMELKFDGQEFLILTENEIIGVVS